MARVLVCAQSYPYPADQGGRIRYARFLEALRHAHDVRLILVRRESDAARAPAPDATDIRFSPARIAGNVLRSAASSIPVQFGAFADARAGAIVARYAKEADAFVAFEPRAGLYHRHIPPELPRVIDLPDSPVLAARGQWAGQRGVVRRLRAIENLMKVRSLEGQLVRAFDIVCVAAPADARWISQRNTRADCRTIPTAVDPVADPAPLPSKPRALFIGDLGFAPNADAVRFLVGDVWPRVLAAAPDARLSIVGHAPGAELRRLLGSAGCESAFSVPDVGPYLEKARVVIAPMRIGSGIKVKVLTAMAAGRPVVITPLAGEGLGAAPGRDALVASDPDDLAGAVVRLFRDDGLARRVAAAGRALVAGRFSSQVVGARFLDALDDALAGPRAARSRRSDQK